jgi:cysteine desulfurase/selenocysteine lyase
MSFKKNFPIFQNNPDLVYLDTTASSQKPKYVIEWICEYLWNSYSNIHRWLYDIAIDSEELYFDSKKKIAEFLWGVDYKEVIYTYNSNYALNILSQTFRLNKVLKAWDKVLISIVEHHSNVVPWLILKEEIWIEIEYVKVTDNFDLDLEDFKSKLDEKVKVVSFTQVSNVTGQIFNLEKVWEIINNPPIPAFPRPTGERSFQKPLFIVDASQSFPHFKVDVKKLWADFIFFTWHKVMADSWIWVLWWKKSLLENYKPIFSGWWAINEVKESCFKSGSLPFRFEPGTPNMTGAVSLLKALEYIENIWWYEKIENYENELVKYSLEQFEKRPQIKLIWSLNDKNRVWVFSFYVDNIHPLDIADELASNNICIRAGQHCTEPFMDYLWIKASCRMSIYIYNDKSDIDKFFSVLDNILENT